MQIDIWCWLTYNNEILVDTLEVLVDVLSLLLLTLFLVYLNGQETMLIDKKTMSEYIFYNIKTGHPGK